MISILSAHGFTSSELGKLHSALELANRVMASEEFKNAVQAHKDDRGIPGFSGAIVTPSTLTDSATALSLSIQSYSWWNIGKRREVAHENADGGVVFNRRFFSTQDLPSLAGSIAHEFTHTLGYSHDWKLTARRPYSVPYAIGDIVERLARELIKQDADAVSLMANANNTASTLMAAHDKLFS